MGVTILLIRADNYLPAPPDFPASLPNFVQQFNRRISAHYLAKSAADRGRSLFSGLEVQLPILLFVVLN